MVTDHDLGNKPCTKEGFHGACGAGRPAPTSGPAVVGRRSVGPDRGGYRNRSVPKRRVRLTDGSQAGRVVG
ncbi:hypothetical protein DLJ59_09330 [Micromonospora inaquosa]|uniref:Uncharacterized protein n=1 Tax=Micromonospora inaquosa TaxID=2203716 RepID=A0A3N9WUX7_9ACTN|nr:hypothetical protein DLJ59_09330 [Micromonospora inaquosa]